MPDLEAYNAAMKVGFNLIEELVSTVTWCPI
jgi:hypothetical protein